MEQYIHQYYIIRSGFQDHHNQHHHPGNLKFTGKGRRRLSQSGSTGIYNPTQQVIIIIIIIIVIIIIIISPSVMKIINHH